MFDRIVKSLYITEGGKHFLQYATHIVRLFEDMGNEVKNLDDRAIWFAEEYDKIVQLIY